MRRCVPHAGPRPCQNADRAVRTVGAAAIDGSNRNVGELMSAGWRSGVQRGGVQRGGVSGPPATSARRILGLPALMTLGVVASSPMTVLFGGIPVTFASAGVVGVPLVFLVIMCVSNETALHRGLTAIIRSRARRRSRCLRGPPPDADHSTAR